MLLWFFFPPLWLWRSYCKIPNDLLFYCELSHNFAGWLKINFRTYINIFSMTLSWGSDSSFIHEESAGFVRVSKPILIFLLDIPKTVINKLILTFSSLDENIPTNVTPSHLFCCVIHPLVFLNFLC